MLSRDAYRKIEGSAAKCLPTIVSNSFFVVPVFTLLIRVYFLCCCFLLQITGGITNVIFKARNAATGEGALVRVYGKDTDLLLNRQ